MVSYRTTGEKSGDLFQVCAEIPPLTWPPSLSRLRIRSPGASARRWEGENRFPIDRGIAHGPAPENPEESARSAGAGERRGLGAATVRGVGLRPALRE